MYTTTTSLRVRYAETDQMGYVYYGNYAVYYEVARVEALRKLNFPYDQLEKQGILMPVRSFHITYLRPAHYDDMLDIEVSIPTLPETRIWFTYKLFRNQELLNTGKTELVFLNKNTYKLVRAPMKFVACLASFFTKNQD